MGFNYEVKIKVKQVITLKQKKTVSTLNLKLFFLGNLELKKS